MTGNVEEVQPQTEREKYVAKLEAKLRRAGRARRFLDNEDGKLATEWLQEQINILLKGIAGSKYVKDHDGYIYDLGQLHLAQKMLNTLNQDANTNTAEIQEQLTEAKIDG